MNKIGDLILQGDSTQNGSEFSISLNNVSNNNVSMGSILATIISGGGTGAPTNGTNSLIGNISSGQTGSYDGWTGADFYGSIPGINK